MKLYYFAAPGRAENTRVMLHYGGVPFEDVRFNRDQWQELKPKMPFHQAPVLELDNGSMIAQSSAIDLQEKIAKRKEIASTTLHAKLELLEKALGDKDHFVGDKLTYADISVFTMMSGLSSGFMDGLDKSIFKDFPKLQAFHAKVAALPAIKAYYETMHDDLHKAYKPDFFAHSTEPHAAAAH